MQSDLFGHLRLSNSLNRITLPTLRGRYFHLNMAKKSSLCEVETDVFSRTHTDDYHIMRDSIWQLKNKL